MFIPWFGLLSQARTVAPWMEMSAGWSTSVQTEISTTEICCNEVIVMNPQDINPYDFGHPLACPLASPTGQYFH